MRRAYFLTCFLISTSLSYPGDSSYLFFSTLLYNVIYLQQIPLSLIVIWSIPLTFGSLLFPFKLSHWAVHNLKGLESFAKPIMCPDKLQKHQSNLHRDNDDQHLSSTSAVYVLLSMTFMSIHHTCKSLSCLCGLLDHLMTWLFRCTSHYFTAYYTQFVGTFSMFKKTTHFRPKYKYICI